MQRIVRLVRAQWIGSLALLISLAGVASGATPRLLQLAETNRANGTTTLTNVGSGPAIAFNVKQKSPPFTVNSSKLIRKLNAARLGGKGPRAFAPRTGSPNYMAAGSVYTRAQSDARYAPASGSVNYVRANSPRLMLIDSFSGEVSGTGPEIVTVVSKAIVAPAAGTVVVVVDARCLVVPEFGLTEARAIVAFGPFPEQFKQFSDAAGSAPDTDCDAMYEFGVAAGQTYNVVYYLGLHSFPDTAVATNSGLFQVFFQPNN